jgi:hypothetical protein
MKNIFVIFFLRFFDGLLFRHQPSCDAQESGVAPVPTSPLPLHGISPIGHTVLHSAHGDKNPPRAIGMQAPLLRVPSSASNPPASGTPSHMILYLPPPPAHHTIQAQRNRCRLQLQSLTSDRRFFFFFLNDRDRRFLYFACTRLTHIAKENA